MTTEPTPNLFPMEDMGRKTQGAHVETSVPFLLRFGFNALCGQLALLTDAVRDLTAAVADPVDAEVDEYVAAELDELRARDFAEGAMRCRVCGCTDTYGCQPPLPRCAWVETPGLSEDPLCSNCVVADAELHAAVAEHPATPHGSVAFDPADRTWKPATITGPLTPATGPEVDSTGYARLRVVADDTDDDAQPQQPTPGRPIF